LERQLEAIALAVANADPRLIPAQIRNAYAAGATVPQVLTAVEVGCCLADVPATIILEAQRSAEDWAWLAQRKA
jgi:alkylhydroperoxidase/carboxymuconolactone decarboxylase family protein YurZ